MQISQTAVASQQRWPKMKTRRTLSVGETRSSQGSDAGLARGTQARPQGKALWFIYYSYRRAGSLPSKTAPSVYPRENLACCEPRPKYENVHSSSDGNGPNLEIIPMPNRKLEKNLWYSCRGTFHSNENEQNYSTPVHSTPWVTAQSMFTERS